MGLSWLPWFISGGTLIWIALAIFAPSILQIITPIIRAIIDGLVEYIRTIWVGLLYILASSSAVVLLGSVGLGSFLYGYYTKPSQKEVIRYERDGSRSTSSSKKPIGQVRGTVRKDEPLIKIPGWMDLR